MFNESVKIPVLGFSWLLTILFHTIDFFISFFVLYIYPQMNSMRIINMQV